MISVSNNRRDYCAQFCALTADQSVSSDNSPAFPAVRRKPFCHKGFGAIEWYQWVPMILCPSRLGCVWSPAQIRPPRPTEYQRNVDISLNLSAPARQLACCATRYVQSARAAVLQSLYEEGCEILGDFSPRRGRLDCGRVSRASWMHVSGSIPGGSAAEHP